MMKSFFAFALFLALSTGCLQAQTLNEQQTINFHALGTPLSGFKLKRMKAKGIKNPKPLPGVRLSGQLILPSGDGPFPLVILNHDCRGINPFHKVWADRLAQWGYAGFLIDVYGPRNVKAGTVCNNLANWDRKDFIASRTSDIYGALDFLRTHPKIDSKKTALLGWDRDSTLSAVASQGIAASNPAIVPNGAIALYPDCRRLSSGSFKVPVLVVAAGKDDWWPATSCTKMSAAAALGNNASVKLLVLKEAAHGFDDPEVGEKLVIEDAYNPNKNPALGATFAYDKSSTEIAVQQVKIFLQQILR